MVESHPATVIISAAAKTIWARGLSSLAGCVPVSSVPNCSAKGFASTSGTMKAKISWFLAWASAMSSRPSTRMIRGTDSFSPRRKARPIRPSIE